VSKAVSGPVEAVALLLLLLLGASTYLAAVGMCSHEHHLSIYLSSPNAIPAMQESILARRPAGKTTN